MEHWYQNPHMSLFEIQQSNSIQDFSKNILGTLFLLFKNVHTNMLKIIVCHFQQDCNVAESNDKLKWKCSILAMYNKR
jgi:hypothetical protein